jgi:hypothetical protein
VRSITRSASKISAPRESMPSSAIVGAIAA